MNRPRPTMTPEDLRGMREFFDSPEGKRVLGQIQASMEVQPLTERRGETFWRASPPGATPYPLEVELANETAMDATRVFPAPTPTAHRVSFWRPIIGSLIVILCTGAMAVALLRCILAAVGAHS